MEKIPLSKFAVALLSVLVCSSSTYAQGIYQGSQRVDNIDDFAIDAESTEPLTFRFESPLDGYPASINQDAKNDLFLSGNKMLSIAAAERSENVSYSLSEVKVYPNPTSGVIKVELPAEDDYSLSVSDMSGRIVTAQQGYGNTINVDLAGQAKGSYPFQLQTTVGSVSNVIILK